MPMQTPVIKKLVPKSRAIANNFTSQRQLKPVIQKLNMDSSLSSKNSYSPITTQGKNLITNEHSDALQQKTNKIANSYNIKPFQLRADKRVEASAQKHYNDGWGAKYGVQNETDLKAKVSDSVKGYGTVDLGYFVKNSWMYKGDSYRNLTECNIIYTDREEGWGKYKSKYTSIYHCGPTGGAIQQYWDGNDWEDS